MTKNIAIILFIGIIFIFKAQASDVSLLIIETGLSQDDGYNQHSETWESAFFDVFFETGHIISSSPVIRVISKPTGDFPQEANTYMENTRGVEFVIIVQLDYKSGIVSPENITLKLFRVDPLRKIHEQQFVGRNYRNTREELDNLKILVRGLVPYMNNRS